MRITRIDFDVQVFLPAGVPAGLFQILWEHAVRTFEGLLAAVAELEFAALEFYGVINVVGDAAERIPVGGHAVTQPQKITPIKGENNQHDNDESTLHCFAGYL